MSGGSVLFIALFFIGGICLLHFLCNPAAKTKHNATQKENMNAFSVCGNRFNVCRNRDNVGRNALEVNRHSPAVNTHFPGGNSNNSRRNPHLSRRNRGFSRINKICLAWQQEPPGRFPGANQIPNRGSRTDPPQAKTGGGYHLLSCDCKCWNNTPI